MTADFDILVVGSGPLGVATARRLAEQGRRVLILEAGPPLSDPPGSHTRNAEPYRRDGDAYIQMATGHLDFFDDSVPRERLPGAAVTKAMGGQGIIWTNLCPRGDAPWAALTTAEWTHYYEQAEAYLGVQASAFESSKRQQTLRSKLNAHLADAGRKAEALPVAARFQADDTLHFTAPHDILAGSEAAEERVELRHGAVERLLVIGPRITGVKTGDETLQAETVIVAAGAIGTPQLLHRSDIRPRALGRWLSYHPLLVAQLVLDEAFCAAPGNYDREPRLQIRPSAEAEWYSLVLRDVSPFEPEAADANIDPNRLVEIQGICPVDPLEANGIRFDEKSWPSFEVPVSDADQARMAGAERDADEICALLGRYRQGCQPTWMPFGFAHMTGTTRMSAEDDGSGVADYQGRVWGYENLYLATNGLIPTRMAVNPTLTGVALAIRVADAITEA